MNRRLAGPLACAVLGALASYGVVRSVQQSVPVAVRPSQESEASSIRTSAPSSSFVDVRLAVFERAAALEDPASIEQAILRAARSAPSVARDVELEALLLRYLEMDSAHAIRFATTEQALEARFVAAMFQALASRDPEAAFAALAEVADAGLRRSVARALVDVFQSSEAIERLAAIAAQDNPQGFVVTALQRLASLDPFGAIREAERLPDASLRAETFERVAREWVFLDASAALSYVAQIDVPSLRNRFHSAAVSAWIMADPDAALAYLQSREGGRLLAVVPHYRSENLINTIAFRLSIDGPERLLALAEGFAGTDSYAGTIFGATAAILAFEENWPEELARLETMPFSAEFQALAVRVASEYARADPVAAVAWAKALDPPSVAKAAIERIVLEIGYSDPLAAFDVALANDVQYRFGTCCGPSSPEDFAAIADRLFAGGSTQQTSLEALMELWPRRDPEGQWAWLLNHADSVDASIFKNTASAFARMGHALPAQTIYRLPETLREHWVVGFASEYVRREPDAGLRWLRELEGDPEYDRWATAVLHNLLVTVDAIRADPRMLTGTPVLARPAAEIIATMPEPPTDLVVATATFWARTEPMEVARWASRLADADARTFGVVAGIGGWTVNDPAAARRFALGLPTGETRDRALVAQLVQEIATHGSASPDVVSAIGTRDDLAEALRANRPSFTQAFRFLGSRDPDAATALLDRYVADPEMKSAFQAVIDLVRSGGRPLPREVVISIQP